MRCVKGIPEENGELVEIQMFYKNKPYKNLKASNMINSLNKDKASKVLKCKIILKKIRYYKQKEGIRTSQEQGFEPKKI